MKHFLKSLSARLRALSRRQVVEEELDDELRFHVDMQTEANIRAGMSPAEARRQALITFGGLDGHKDECRDARGTAWIDTTVADIHFAFRQFRRRPLSTATMVVVLALGIGANTGLFAVLHSVATLPPPGVARDDAVVRIRGQGRLQPNGPVGSRDLAYAEILAFAEHGDLFSEVAGWTDADVLLDPDDGAPGAIAGTVSYVTGDYFRVLRVTPVVGAGLPVATSRGDDATSMVGLISHAMWMQRFGGTADVVGRTVNVNGATITVAGVAPPRFQGVNGNRAPPDLWLPLAARATLQPHDSSGSGRVDSPQFNAIARLRNGITAEQATRTVAAIAAGTTFDPTGLIRHDPSADVVPLLASNAQRGSSDGAILAGASIAIALIILLVTCTNVSALLVGSAATRRREISVRLSLGAPRKRIVRQLLTESSLVAMLGGALGLSLLWLAVRGIRTSIPELPLAIHWTAVAFTLAIAIATGILFGLSPALHATRLSVAEVLKDSAAAVSAPRTRLQRGLVVAQIALTQPLLVALGATFFFIIPELSGGPSTELMEHVASVRFNMRTRNTSVEQTIADITRLRERIAAIPGIQGAVFQFPGYRERDMVVHPADRLGQSRGEAPFTTLAHPATPGYLALMDIPLLRGRDFTPEENNPDATSIIIGDNLARSLWGTADPIGKRLRYADRPASDSSSLTVVGVVDESRTGDGEYGSYPIFTPTLLFSNALLIRTAGAAEAVLPVVRAVAAAEAPSMPMIQATTLASIAARERRVILRANAAISAGAVLALLLSAVGLYAVVAFAIARRTREIGIRTALGAAHGQVVRMFFVNGLRLTAIGLVIGLPLSLLALRLFAGQMRMAQPSTPVLAVSITAIVSAVAAIATWIPARRAAGVDPLTALRMD